MSTQLSFRATAASAEQPCWVENKCIFWAPSSIKTRTGEHWSQAPVPDRALQTNVSAKVTDWTKMDQSSPRCTLNDSNWRRNLSISSFLQHPSQTKRPKNASTKVGKILFCSYVSNLLHPQLLDVSLKAPCWTWSTFTLLGCFLCSSAYWPAHLATELPSNHNPLCDSLNVSTRPAGIDRSLP